MEHQVQGLVLVDGEWVSRPADVYEIMARVQQQADNEMMREPESKPQRHVPELGILSRTVFGSPFVKFVLPANIRHKKLNDVVFVGEHSIHLKEIGAYGHLRHAATKSNFTGKIIAARKFGDPRKVEVSTEYGTPLKRAAVHAERRSGGADEPDVLPPEVIVLTLSSRTLMFLWARQTRTGSVDFRQRTVRLPASTSRHDRLGAFLAIDPKCRAMAVAAPEGRFILYQTKTMDRWRVDVREGRDEVPIVDERLFSIQGRIMHMEFLSPGTTHDDSHVVLLFVLAHGGKTKISCYDWDARYDLSTASARAERLSVDPEDHNPSLLIPLSQNSDFLLVCDRHITTYKHILSGAPQRYKTPIQAQILSPLLPADSRNAPRWVQWDKVLRWYPEIPKEAFYIAREDGVVVYAELGPANSVETNDAGKWPYPIDKAFASLDMDSSARALSYPDVLVAAGTASDGHLCKVGEWPTEYSYAVPFTSKNTFASVESIPNWAPIADSAVTRLPGVQSPFKRERDGIFVANGRAPHGTISEMRRGLNGLVEMSFGGMKGCTGMWVIDHGTETCEVEGRMGKQHYAVFIATLPPESIIMRISRNVPESGSQQGGSWSAWEDGVWDSTQFPNDDESAQDDILRDETISACSWTDQFAIQITRNEARMLRRSDLTKVNSLLFSTPALAGATGVLKAATKSHFPFIAVAFLGENARSFLQVVSISDDGAFGKGIRHELGDDPTCIELLDIGGVPHVFVGTFNSYYCLFKIDEAGLLLLVYDGEMHHGARKGLSMQVESAVLLASGEHPIIVCGTRSGFMLSLCLKVADKRYELLSTHLTRMGTMAAQLTQNAIDSSAAFLACGSDFCRVRRSRNGSSTVEVDSIWFTDREDPNYQQSPVTAIDQLPLDKSGEYVDKGLEGFIFAVSGDRILFAQMDYDIRWSSSDILSTVTEREKAIPRKLITSTTPIKLLYMEYLHKMAVATIETREMRAPPAGYRTLHSTVKLIKLEDDGTEIKQEEEPEPVKNELVAAEFILDPYEQVSSMLHWTFVRDKGRRYHFLIVGTTFWNRTGRRLFLLVTETGITLKKEYTYNQPVRCMALYDTNQLVTIVGISLFLEEYDHAAGKWRKLGEKQLPSPGVHLTVSRPFVYVSTSLDSHICYETKPGRGWDAFEKVFTDSRERTSAHHLLLQVSLPTPEVKVTGEEASPQARSLSQLPTRLPRDDPHTIVLLTDKNCSVTGLFHAPERTHKSATDILFEACLPRSITRIHRGDVRPPWRRIWTDYALPGGFISGVVADDIIGTSSDGAVYAFSILTVHALRLLKLMHNLIESKQQRDPENQFSIVRQGSGYIFDVLMSGADGSQDERIKARDVDPRERERGAAKPRSMWVDGDVITRFLDGEGSLRELVREGTEEDVWALFGELCANMGGEVAGGGDDEQKLECVEKWMREVLMPVL